MLTNILLIGLMILLLVTVILTFAILYKKVFPYLEKKNELRDREIKNKRLEIYRSLSLEAIDKEIEDYVQRQVDRYITYKFIANKVTFINSDDTELMIRDITKLIVLESSEVYVEYMKLLVAIRETEDFVKYVNNRVKNTVIMTVSSYNKAEIL